MSAILMCDNCGNIFSVNEKGWRQFTESGDTPEYHNVHNHGAMTKHIGPCCNKSVGTPRPRMPEITSKVEASTNGD